mmetsp:Transcript_97735/g.276564  ORF Transcript_97735/g.276564 Transcript_97735/m.276564 type:complete len:264 (-) Transcript_97735:1757-2548(-)
MPPRSLAPASRHSRSSSQPRPPQEPLAGRSPCSTRFGGTWMMTSDGKSSLAARASPGRAAAASAPKSVVLGPPGRSCCEEPSEWGCRITSCTWPNSCANLAMASSASRRSEGVSPTPTSRPVVKGTPSSPACLSCAKRTSGRLLGAKRCTPPRSIKDGAVCSSMRPMDALTAASRSISIRDKGPTFVWGKKPIPRASKQMASILSTHFSRFPARGCTSPAMTRISTTCSPVPPPGNSALRRAAASLSSSQSRPSGVTSRLKLQ